MNADLLQRLIEAGTPIALVAEVAERLAEAGASERILAGRRARDRQRKAAARSPAPGLSAEAAESAEIPAAPSPDKSPPHPQKLTPNPPVREAGARTRGAWLRLPEGWRPTRPLPPAIRAKADLWPPGAIEDELAALHRWAANAKDEAGRGRKRDWDTAWANWIERRHNEQYGRRRDGRIDGMGRSGDGLSPTTRAAARVFGPAGPGLEPSVPR